MSSWQRKNLKICSETDGCWSAYCLVHRLFSILLHHFKPFLLNIVRIVSYMIWWFTSFLNSWCLTDSPHRFSEIELSDEVSQMQPKDSHVDVKGSCLNLDHNHWQRILVRGFNAVVCARQDEKESGNWGGEKWKWKIKREKRRMKACISVCVWICIDVL